MTETPSLLPPRSTALERSIEQIFARSDTLPVEVVADLWDPATCRLDLLPWLAWALGVEIWDSAWSESVKRAVVAAAPAVRRRKGTLGAVRRALQAVDFDVSLIEWFDDAPPAAPYTFRAEVEVTGRPIDDETESQIVALITSAKNARSHLTTLDMIGRVDGAVHPAAAACGYETARILPFALSSDDLPVGLAFAGGLAGWDTASVYPGPH